MRQNDLKCHALNREGGGVEVIVLLLLDYACSKKGEAAMCLLRR